MSHHAIAGRATVAGTALRAIASVFSSAAAGFVLREIGVFNTTTTACAVALARFTAATNVGAGLTEADYAAANVAACTGFAGHTGDGTVGQVFRQASVGAAIGSGVIWTFGGTGIIVPVGTANGIGIIIPVGTGQILDYYYDWEE